MSHMYLERFSQSLPTLFSAHCLAKVMVAISKASTSKHLHSSIGQSKTTLQFFSCYPSTCIFLCLPASTCQTLLQRKWAVVGTNQQRSEALEYLLRYHVEWSPDPLNVLESIAGEGVTDLLGEDASEESTTYPTLST